MKTQRLLASASTAVIAGAAGAAGAADLAVRGPAPVWVPTWTGLYVGINGGVITHYNTVQDLSNWTDIGYMPEMQSKNTGGMFGGQIGYNIQDNNFVYGIEADWDWTGARGDKTLNWAQTFTAGPNRTPTPGGALIHSGLDSLATVRGRAGLVVGTTLAYATAGIAWGQVDNHWGAGYANSNLLNTNGSCFGSTGRGPCGPINNNNFVQSRSQFGWVAGFGIEHMFTSLPRWIFRVEAMWVDLGKSTVVNNGPSFANGVQGQFFSEFHNQAMLARVGVNYKFW
jgi:outer membrane immunogenic protein